MEVSELLLVIICGVIGGTIEPCSHLGLALPNHLLHHPARLSWGPIGASNAFTASCCQHHVANAMFCAAPRWTEHIIVSS